MISSWAAGESNCIHRKEGSANSVVVLSRMTEDGDYRSSAAVSSYSRRQTKTQFIFLLFENAQLQYFVFVIHWPPYQCPWRSRTRPLKVDICVADLYVV